MLGLNQAQYQMASETLKRYETEDEFELDDILQFAASTIVDIGVTAVDSLTFGAFDLDTQEVLNGTGAGMGLGEYYEKHQEGINLASFIGGMVIPGMAASKALKFARAGSTPFATLNRNVLKYKTEALTLTKNAGATDKLTKEAIKSAKLWTIGEAAAESAIYEASFALFMNKHAYMDNDYSLTDAALGITLGMVAVPFRFAKIKRELTLGQEAIEKESLHNMLLPANARNADQGTQQGILANRLVEMAKIDTRAGKGLPTDMATKQELAVISGRKMLSDHIKKLMSNDLLGLEGGLREKAGKTTLIGDYSSVYEAHAAKDRLVKMSLGNPGWSVGVTKYGIFDIKNLTADMAGGVRKSTDGLEQVVRSAKEARKIFFYKQSAKIVTDTPDKIKAKLPEHIIIDETADTIRISSEKKLGQRERQLISDYLGLPHAQGKETRLAGTLGDLEMKSKTLQDQAIDANFALFTKSTPWQDALPHLNPDATGGVLHPFMEGHVIGGAMAASAQTAAMDTTTQVFKAGYLKGIGAYLPWETSSSHLDAGFINAQYWAKAHKPKLNQIFHEDQINVLQALTLHVEDVPWVPVSFGKTKLSNKEEAIRYLIEKKGEFLKEGLDKGYSKLQLAVILNIPSEAVQEFIDNGRKFLVGSKFGINQYDKLSPDAYLKTGAIHVMGKAPIRGAIDELNLGAMLDEQSSLASHNEFVNAILSKTQSGGDDINTFLSDVLYSEPMREIQNNLPALLSTAARKSVLWLSSNQALRSLGPVGDHLSTMADNFSEVVNGQIRRHNKILDPLTAVVTADAKSANQFSFFKQALHSFSGKEASNFSYDPIRRVIVQQGRDAERGVDEVLMKYVGTDEVIKFTPQLDEWIQAFLPIMDDQHSLLNASKSLNSLPKEKGVGIWLPHYQVQSEFMGFQINKATQETKMVLSNTAEGLAEEIDKLQKLNGLGTDAPFEYITRANAESMWNDLNRYAELERLGIANPDKAKSGITALTPVPGKFEINNMRQALTNDSWSKYRHMFRAANAPMFDQLEFMAEQAASAAKSSTGFLAQKIQKKVTNPEIIYNLLLGKSMMKSTPMMDIANNWTTIQMNGAINKARQLAEVFKVEGKAALTGKGAEKAWAKYNTALVEAGIPVPYKDAMEYITALKQGGNLDTAQHFIATKQSILVTLNLRFLEAAHAMVTVASIPVIMAGEIAHQKQPLKIMIQAAKFAAGQSDESRVVMKIGRDKHYTKAIVAETSELMADMAAGSGFIKKHEELIKTLSWASDNAEKYARTFAFAQGYLIAKAKWPMNSMAMNISHAAAFTKRTMGNYASKQKPTLFQGTFGSMIGLYQTFMLTMGQNLYRYAEAGDKKAIARLIGAQAGMFGMESLPFFQDFNTMVGEYASDEHTDIRNTVYKVFGNVDDKSVKRAEFLLFGLPSTVLGSGFYTRGQLAPRGPVNFTSSEGISIKPAVLDAFLQAQDVAFRTAGDIKNTAKSGGSILDLGEAALQGLAAQSLWRPGARVAEILMGKSYDQKGELISTREEVQEPFSILSRALATRPLQEQALRNLKYQSSYYSGVDSTRRDQVIRQVRRLASDGEDIAQIENLYLEYIENGGKHRGWNQIVAGAYQAAGTPYAERIADYVKKNPAIVEISEMYGQ